MVNFSNSNVFNTNADAIVNTINCVGFMGKGLALEYSLRYPELLVEYKKLCDNKEIQIGKIYYFETDDKLIVNFPTKKDYKFPSKIEWIEAGLKDFINTYKNYNIKTVAFPLLGCGNGNLDYNMVLNLMKKYLENLDIDVIICLDKNGVEGKEKEMIDAFNKCNIYDLSNEIKLNTKQVSTLVSLQDNITRFSQILAADGVGFGTYKKLFSYFYNMKNSNIQQSLF